MLYASQSRRGVDYRMELSTILNHDWPAQPPASWSQPQINGDSCTVQPSVTESRKSSTYASSEWSGSSLSHCSSPRSSLPWEQEDDPSHRGSSQGRRKVFSARQRDWIWKKLWKEWKSIPETRAAFLIEFAEDSMERELDGQPMDSEDKKNNVKYTDDQMMFIRYHKNDLDLHWIDCLFAFMAYFDTWRQTCQALQGVSYRDNRVGIFREDGSEVLGQNGCIMTRRCRTRDRQHETPQIPLLDKDGQVQYSCGNKRKFSQMEPIMAPIDQLTEEGQILANYLKPKIKESCELGKMYPERMEKLDFVQARHKQDAQILVYERGIIQQQGHSGIKLAK